MKKLLADPKKCTLISVISLIIVSFSFALSLVSVFGIYYIPTFSGWFPLLITFIVLFVIAFVIALVINIMAFKNNNIVIIKDNIIDNNSSNIKKEKEDLKIQISE
ncbi:MAG: hypothetical protein ACRCUM_00515 [Mycoplasmoidaceae bacterium]